LERQLRTEKGVQRLRKEKLQKEQFKEQFN